ncbi:MAG TPA: sialidase family protein [Ktedonobacterales bacterium]
MERLTRVRLTLSAMALPALLALALAGCAGGDQGQHATSTATSAPGSSTNALASWTPATPPAATFALQFAPSEPQTAYLCAIDGPAATPLDHTARLYKSVDGAKTWGLIRGTPVLRPVASQARTPAMCAVFIDAHDARDVFFQQTQLEPEGAGFAIARALYRSRDGGATWATLAVPDHTDGFQSLAVYGARLVARHKPSVLGATTCESSPGPKPTSLVDASDDGGQTWQLIGQNLMAQGYLVTDMATAGAALFVIAYQVPASACQQATHWTAFRSDDAGATWKSTTISESALASLSFTPRLDGSGYYGVALAPLDGSGSAQVDYSTDSGVTWQTEPLLDVSSGGSDPAIAVASSGEIYAQASGANMVYRLAPGASSPAWAPYAAAVNPGQSEASGVWMVEPLSPNERLWSLEVAYGVTPDATLAYLPLP